ncbi:SU10 major capsid protein [Thermobrachium celere]|uniref:SU10 major capsid protein n=1 Tax=Thermobrachium celere TaxID=53422 RepID=UPI00194215D5|nr:DUF5309 family protein [Thermobrachium celere]GFR35350.1 hypothetical protein TCEA9_11620 [Thermobrachium celere]
MIKTANLTNEIIDLSKELVLLDNVNLPFSSMLLKKGTEKVSSVIVNWTHENLDNSRQLALEGADVSSFQASTRTTDKNICQIIQKAVSISNTAQAVSIEAIADLFAHEVQNRMLEAKRDLEYYLINGVYTEENGSTPRQMKGLLSWVENSMVVTSGTGIDVQAINSTVKKMREKGTASQRLVMLCNYSMIDRIHALLNNKVQYIAQVDTFGNSVQTVITPYGNAMIYLVDSIPDDGTAIGLFVNMDYLKLAELRPLQYHDLATTGDSKKGYIVMENTLKVTNPYAIAKLVISN